MKVQNNSIYMSDDIRSARHGENGKTNNIQRKSIDGTALHAKFDPVVAKREEAKKKAMKIVKDAFAKEMKMDDDLNARREKIKTLEHGMGEANKSIKEIEDGRSALRDVYGVDTDSQEEQDLKLLEKEIRYKIPGNDVHFDDGDIEKIAELKKNGLTEYQQRSLEMLEHEVPYATTAYDNKQEIMVENLIISATKLERLKSDPMGKAQKQADAIMDEASKEIVGMLVDEAKEHIDEEADKEKEKAEAEKEKAEELQERIDVAKEKKKENEELTEDILEGVADATQTSTDVKAAQQEIKDMMNKMKLIEEDIKGAAVDKTL